MLAASPIVTECAFSCLQDLRSLRFYIFDGTQQQNLAKAYSLFEQFGATLSADVQAVLTGCRGDELYCHLAVNQHSVVSLGLELTEPSPAEDLLQSVDPACSFAAKPVPDSVGLWLTAAGYSLALTCHCN